MYPSWVQRAFVDTFDNRGGDIETSLVGYTKNKDLDLIKKGDESHHSSEAKVFEPGLHLDASSRGLHRRIGKLPRMRRPRICEVRSRNNPVTKAQPVIGQG